MPTFAAVCLALGITCLLYSFQAINDYYMQPDVVPDQPWPYRELAGTVSGVLVACGLISWLG